MGVRLKNINAGVMELADVMDSKSIVGDNVPVRVRPPAPRISQAHAKKFSVGLIFYVFMTLPL